MLNGTEQNFQGLWGNYNRNDIYIVGIPEGEKEQKKCRKLQWWKFSQINVRQWTTNLGSLGNTKQDKCPKVTTRHIIFKLQKIKYKKIWKKQEEKTILLTEGQRLESYLSSPHKQKVDTSGEGNGNPLQYSCLENPMDRGAWYLTVHGVPKSWTWLNDFTFTNKANKERMEWNVKSGWEEKKPTHNLKFCTLQNCHLWNVNFLSVSLYFPPIRWDRMARVGWRWLFLFSHVS